ncbi:MAG: sensor histidine kinase, partial [Moraxellaceae bacterium]
MTAPHMLRASRHYVWHWLCWVVLCIVALPVQAVVDVPADRPAVPLWQALAWQPEPAGAEVPADMVASTAFRAPPAYPNWGFAPGRPHWFRFTLRNPGQLPQARLLHIDFPLLDHVQLFVPDGQGGYTESRTGDTEPWGARPLALRQLALPLVLPPGEHDFYLRVASSSNLLIPAQVHSPASFWALMSRQQLIEGAFYGAMALVLLYNLFLFASARERIFLYYVLALLPTLGYLFILDGFGFALVPVPGLWQNLSISVCIGLANLAYLQFARHFLNLPAASAWARSTRLLMACCLVSVLLLPLLGPSWGAVLVLLMGVLVSMFMLAMGLAALQQGRREALYFVLGWSLFLVNAVAAVLSVFALVPWFAFFITGIKLGLLWTVSWLSLGLGLYLRRLKAESLRSREQVLRAEAQSQAKSQFLAMMSHEIRTPMNGVLGMAELLRTTGLSAEQVRILDTMEASGNALLEVINDVLDHAKIESGRMDLELVTLDLDRLVEEALALFRARIYKQQLTLLCSIAPDVPTEIEGDALRLRQVLTNLLSNAVKFTAHGQIELAIEAFGEGEQVGLRFMFRDTGIGIAPEQLPHIFDSFVQADVSTSRRYGGSGLGLSISRDLCRLMGGDLSVQSAPGQGSVFTATVRARRVPGARPRLAWPAELAPLRLLLVDGDARFCEVMAREAASSALVIETAASGEAALARLRAAAQ